MKVFKSPIFWIIVAVVLIYGYFSGWFVFHKPSTQTPPTNVTGGTSQIK